MAVSDDVRHRYPADLVDLVQRCLDPRPDYRIGAAQLVKEIRRIVQEFPEDFDGVPLKFTPLGEHEILRLKADSYPLKLAR